MAERIRERSARPFSIPRDTIDAVPVHAVNRLQSDPDLDQRTRQVGRTVHETGGLLDILSVTELVQEPCTMSRAVPAWNGRTRKNAARRGIASSGQPVPVVVDPNQRSVDRTVVRVGVAAGLSVGSLSPVVNGGSTTLDTDSRGCIWNP